MLDLGCGFGAVAEPCRRLGLTYVGADLDDDGPSDLRGRGFEAHTLDLAVDGLGDRLTAVLAGRRLAAVCLLDTLEHVVDPPAVLRELRRVASADAAPLVVSVPNVSHYDVAVKLLQGRWDVTDTGLLDRTHLAFFTSPSLDRAMLAAGWSPIAREDFRLAASDQRFPADMTAFRPATSLHRLLMGLRQDVDDAAEVNQFVRAYLPGPVRPAPAPPAAPAFFLSVLVRTQGLRPELLQETLLSLAAQTRDDFEVIVLAHDATVGALDSVNVTVAQLPPYLRERTRVVVVSGGGRGRPLNAGVAASRAAYVCVVDDDDVVFGHYVEEFGRLADRHPGRMLRARVAEQDVVPGPWPDRPGFRATTRVTSRFPARFSLVEHLYSNQTPLCGLAFPVPFFRDLGQQFDENLSVLEDWDVLLRCGSTCGAASTAETTSLYRKWRKGGDNSAAAHADTEWTDALHTVTGRLDQRVLLLPPGSVSQLRTILHRHEDAVGTAAHFENEARALRAELASTRAHAEGLMRTQEEQARAAAEALAAPRRPLPWRVLRRVARRLRRR